MQPAIFLAAPKLPKLPKLLDHTAAGRKPLVRANITITAIVDNV
jgi:hypothetical protein